MSETLYATLPATAFPLPATACRPPAESRPDVPEMPELPPAPREIARALAGRADLWRPLVRFEEPRFYTRVAVGPEWEAWLLTWLPGQSTGLHDHGGSAGAFTVLSGVVDESVLLPAAATVAPSAGRPGGASRTRLRSRRYRAGEVRSFGFDHLHDVAARSGRRAVTLHVYTPRLTTMTRYALTEGGLVATSHERVGRDW